MLYLHFKYKSLFALIYRKLIKFKAFSSLPTPFEYLNENQNWLGDSLSNKTNKFCIFLFNAFVYIWWWVWVEVQIAQKNK